MVGSRVIELLSKDYEIIAPSSEELNLLEGGSFEKYCNELSLDPESGFRMTVINFVAYTNVDKAEEEKDDKDGMVYRLNAGVVKEISEYCKEQNNRLIHISTDYVFDGEKETSPYVEEDNTNPLGWYGKTKLIGEKYVEDSGADYVTLRIEMPYGSNSPKKKDLATILYERLKNAQPIQAISDANISPVYIDDLAEVLKKVIEQQDIVELYHVAPTDSVTLEQFVRLIAKHGGLDDSAVTTISFDEYWKSKLEAGAAKRPRNSWMDSSKLSKDLGIELKSVEENIEDWLKS